MNKHVYQKYIAGFMAIMVFFSLFAGASSARAKAALNVSADGALGLYL
ncbi:hypothetical protein PH210_06280 [Paenibacillus sp. BSR1-1]|nr:hypothetical protein [Paenibacillus sp. BSR1-1]MDN3015813.1 hypothetical protein [Paenibacillus sp. BSR1-1]